MEVIMANLKKYTKNQLGHLLKHIERAKDNQGNYVRFSNQSIDLDKTHLNYELHNRNDNLSNYEFITAYAEKNNILKRKDVNYLCSWVVTLPESLKDSSAEEQRKFFEESYKFIADRYGKQNMAFATVHNDETTPHMHMGFVPVVYDKTKGKTKVSAKEVVTRQDLQTFHKDLDQYMKKVFGLDIGVLTTGGVNRYTKGSNRSIEELKQEAYALQNTNSQLRDNNKHLKAQISSYQQLLEEMDVVFDELNDGDKAFLLKLKFPKTDKSLYQALLEDRQSRGIERVADIRQKIKAANNQGIQSSQQKKRDTLRNKPERSVSDFKDKGKEMYYKNI